MQIIIHIPISDILFQIITQIQPINNVVEGSLHQTILLKIVHKSKES